MPINPVPGNFPLNSTYGLNDDWRLAIEVAEKYDCLHDLFLLLDTLVIHKKVSTLGSALKVISTPDVNQFLGTWAPNNQVASQLYKLSSVVQHNQHLFDVYIPLTDQEPASRQFHNQLQTDYMLAVLVERVPPGGNTERAWFESLRIWLLVHAMQRARHGNCQDDLLRKAADHIRLAAANMDDRLKLIQSLRSPIEDFDSLNNQIIFKSDRLPDKKELPPTAYDFLKTLVKVAKGEHKSEQNQGAFNLLHQRLVSGKTAISPAPLLTELPWPQDEDDETVELELIDGEEDEGNIATVPVDSDDSYELQRLSSGAVLLQAVEEAQLLPWSWGRPNTLEIQMLGEEVRRLVASSNPADQLLGAFVWLTLRTGRSLRRVLNFQVSPVIINPEWTLDPHSMELRRSVPMRTNGWVPSGDAEESWVRPVAKMNRISMPQQMGDVIGRRISASPVSQWLWELWDTSWPTDPERHFRALMKERLPRLTPGMLGGVLPQQCYLETRDEILARMLSAHPQSGLPAACAYANWTATDPALKAFKYENDADWLETQPIVMGSRLDPIEHHLVAAVSEFTSKLKHDQSGLGVVACHNISTIYVLMMLFAASGARPVRDPFESVLHFDFEEHFVYLDDKAIETGRNARLVPLPVRLSNYIKQHYMAHLRSLGRLLQEANPSLAAEISAMAEGRPSGRLPFFFLLEEEHGIAWTSVTGNSVMNMGLQDCPLPPNLFRQRLDKQLRRRGVDSEIIAGIFGHADAGSESYGDFSTRVWVEDASIVRHALAEAFDALPFELLPIIISGSVRRGDATPGQSGAPVLFGAAAREQARLRFNLNAVRLAGMEIEDFLDKRQLSQLGQDEVDDLSRRMLFHINGLPRRNGAIRYEHMLRRLERECTLKGKKVRIGKRYIVQHPTSPFSAAAPRVNGLLQRARQAVEAGLQSRPPSKLTITDCVALAPVLVALECLIADKKALLQVSTGQRFRLLRLMGSYYVELGNEDSTADALIVRRKITPYCAYLLARLRAGKRSAQIDKVRVPDFLLPLAEVLSAAQSPNTIHHSAQLISAVATVVDQHNAMNMPGVLAGYLGGRVKSSSLSLSNWLRLEYGAPVRLPGVLPAEDRTTDPEAPETPIISSLGSAFDDASGTAQEQTRQLFARIRSHLNEASSYGRGTATRSRPQLKVMIDRELKQARSKVASAPMLLGFWVLHLLSMRNSNSYHYAFSSIERYLSALSPCFVGVASKADLMAMDDGDITELYAYILMSTKPGNRGYVGDRLVQFHAFAKTIGVEDPDWDELPLENPSRHVSPGVITNQEYRTALQLFLRSDRFSEYSGDSLAMLLFLCYRFGLRGKEALGLMRSDWLDRGELIVVSVRNNKLRKLKTPGSRRQVPLVFNLLDAEKKLIARHFASLESLFGKEDDCPIFTHERRPLSETDINRMRALVIEILKTVTRDPRTNLHHARHTAINRLALGVFDLGGQIWKGREFGRRDDAGMIISGTAGPTRRATWATARYLGHVRRETQFRNYLHFVSDWADIYLAPLMLPSAKPDHDMIIQLDDLPRLAVLESGHLEKISNPSVAATPGKLVALLRHVAMGKPWEAASQLLDLDRSSAGMMVEVVEAIAERVRLDPHPSGPAMAFLQMIKKPGWNRIMARMEDLSHPDMSMKASATERFDVSGSEVAAMVGASRQLIMWEEKHFRLVRQMLDHFTIPPDLYKVVVSNRAEPEIYIMADTAGFQLQTQNEASAGAYFQLDSVRKDPNTKQHVESRCVVSLQKNSHGLVRTSYELVLLFAVYYVWNQSGSDSLKIDL